METKAVLDIAWKPALSILPERMESPQARIMILTIALQESRLQHRVQIQGPARGYWQFEKVGVKGVLQHLASAAHARNVCVALDYSPDSSVVHTAIQHNDTLACAFARLLLWTIPRALPENAEEGWKQYLEAWRPGRPRPESWERLYNIASEAVSA